jgi:hypothetical protein
VLFVLRPQATFRAWHQANLPDQVLEDYARLERRTRVAVESLSNLLAVELCHLEQVNRLIPASRRGDVVVESVWADAHVQVAAVAFRQSGFAFSYYLLSDQANDRLALSTADCDIFRAGYGHSRTGIFAPELRSPRIGVRGVDSQRVAAGREISDVGLVRGLAEGRTAR